MGNVNRIIGGDRPTKKMTLGRKNEMVDKPYKVFNNSQNIYYQDVKSKFKCSKSWIYGVAKKK